ncbi:helix-turn-helix domain-containing protein [Cytobacillus kochii]|uniref:helix-turn-helix domain-containing protein n=1 Tax=Cytobacillus kochii TaxID=859143 RepID=UPI001CD75B9B|nr:helix-turn-helix transcriptional regulator [Cytobacillus kochii]MCA1026733.1 helix-turn-helix domain-containing protein [Cytobacillus kochii]
MEGKIIKYYREAKKLTQKEIVQGICSITHLSKIERESTQYSSEIIYMLCERLEINMEEEIERFHQFKRKMTDLQKQIIIQDDERIEQLKKELTANSLRKVPDFQASYFLTMARYFLYKMKVTEAYYFINQLQKEVIELTSFEENSLKHQLGIYYFLTGRNKDCIRELSSIDHDSYHQNEYYYHLALAYYAANQNVQAYYYGKKAAVYFHSTMNVNRMIDSETLLLVQLNAKGAHDFKETKDRYEALFRLCEECGEVERKAKVYNNFAYDLHKRKKYTEAHYYYLKALEIACENSPLYAMFLENYIHNGFISGLVHKKELLQEVRKGIELAKTYQWSGLFTFELYSFLIEGREEEAYAIIENKLLPYYRQSGDTLMIEKYEQRLFAYYRKIGDVENAFELAKSLIASPTLV